MSLFFEKLVNPFPKIDNQTPPNTLWGFIRYHNQGYGWVFLALGILEALSAVSEIAIYAFMGQLVDLLSEHDKATFLQSEMPTLLGYSALLLIAMPLINYLRTSLRSRTLNGNLPMSVRWRSHRYLLNQGMSFFQDEFAGRAATKVMQSSMAVREVTLITVSVMVYVLVYFGSMLYVLTNLNTWFLVPMLVWLFIYTALQFYFNPKVRQYSQAQSDARSTMTGRIVDAYTNINTVKLFAHTDSEAEYARDSMDTYLQTVYKQMGTLSTLMITMTILNYILIFATSALSIYLWLNDLVGLGAIAVAVSMALRLLGMSRWVMFELTDLFESLGTVRDGMSLLTKPLTLTDKEGAQPLAVKGAQVDFNNVTFSYHRAGINDGDSEDDKALSIFKDLNLHIKPGKRIGLVGRSGAGKSTLVNLLLRFYDVQGGSICIDGQDISKVEQESLREHIAMVTQDTSLLHRTVRENIIYGKPDATEEELQRAIKQANADEFIDSLVDLKGNKGLDAQVGERGVKLSGGQRQRIAIARVLLKDAPILILDEATSALDSEVEAAIQESLDSLMQDKTVIAIAHRLSTIASMDRLVVMDQGRIIEQGTHQELLAKKGVYASLWERQTGGFLTDE
ncbi:Putative multidrug export ATP-binding/permease protein [Psychrobacter pasteurii]|uniref:Putative multidrug export ATP-binding/permease protein n=1 Tax=Psychrobacter pasteurii TaxID=1945520 RepID=A0A1R4EG39_9GAMM|nr:ABC transporter ATP-binding protein [Psychrobacter pasteurii]SJM37453.1 Putative multidrug export ATP-binding/permease protein [Psychrobacter pasteurii]